MTFVRRRLVALACLPLLLLSACGDGDSEADESRTPSSQSGSPSAFPSPSESPSTLPEDLPADEVDPEEIVEAWVEAYDEATTSGDTERLRKMSSTNCFTCGSLARNLEESYQKGGSFDINEKPTQITSQKVDPKSNSDATRISVVLEFPAGTVQEDAKSKPRRFEASTESWDFYLSVVDGVWIVSDIGT